MTNDVAKFSLGQKVYFVLNSSRVGIIDGILFTSSGVGYYATWDGFCQRLHYGKELTTEKDFATEPKDK